MSQKSLTLGIVGSGGDGIITAGEMLVLSAAADGLYAFLLKSFGPQIRGGESSCRVRIGQEPILTQGDKLDALAVFGWKNYQQFEEELLIKDGVTIFYDENEATPEDQLPIDPQLNRTIHRVPFKQIAQETAGTPLAKNLVMLGTLVELYNLPPAGLEQGIRDWFKRKGEKVVEANLKAFQAGREYAVEKIGKDTEMELDYIQAEPKLVMDGNVAVACGALFAGCDFFAGYPITPSSEIMQFLVKEMPKFGRSVLQVEDELTAMNMLIGASFVGRKALTATSGPGVALMSEALGLAVMAELPCVIVNVQRGGPSTGVPTKTEQSDLFQAIFTTPGDSPVVVLAPTDIRDCIEMTVEAFNLAEKYQTPVIVLSDQFIGQRKECFEQLNFSQFTIENRLTPGPEELNNGEFCRFADTGNGVSKITLPGMKGGQYLACGLAHDECGSPTSRHAIHERMNAKRFKKFQDMQSHHDLIERYGPEDAEIGVVTWGSSRGAVQEAITRLNEEGHKVSALVPRMLYPLPLKKVEEYLRPLKRLLIVELSHGGQFHQYLRSQLDLPSDIALYKRSGCMPFTVEEVYQQIQQLIG